MAEQASGTGAPPSATCAEEALREPVDGVSTCTREAQSGTAAVLAMAEETQAATADATPAQTLAPKVNTEAEAQVEPGAPQQLANCPELLASPVEERRSTEAIAVLETPCEAEAPQVNSEAEAQVEPVAPQQLANCPESQAMAGEERHSTEMPRASAESKRKRASALKTPASEDMAVRVKRLQQEAGEAVAAAKEFEAAAARQIQEIRDAVAAMHAAAEGKTAAARRASQEYISKRCGANLAQLEAKIPRQPGRPFFLFSAEHPVQGADQKERSKKKAEMWASLPAEQKQKYFDQFNAGMRRFKEWGSSEEGQKNLRERNELLRQSRAASMEELESATVPTHLRQQTSADIKTSQQREDVSPAKRAVETSVAAETPAKQPRVAPAKGPRQLSEYVLDESILEEASKAGFSAQLRNLASRPEVFALGKSSHQLLEALKINAGMVNAAKHFLLNMGHQHFLLNVH